jgi:hypothetical protein
MRCSGFVFQTFNLISSMTALENVSLPMVRICCPRTDPVPLPHAELHCMLPLCQILDGRRSRDEIRRRAMGAPSLHLAAARFLN